MQPRTKFSVLSTYIFADVVERVERHDFECLTDAFDKFGKLAPHCNGVILIDQQDCVWAELRPSASLSAMSQQQRIFYQHYTHHQQAA